MPDQCDNKSVGILVWRDGCLLLIERKKFPFGFAPPAGHIDDHGSFEQAAKDELLEEVGLSTQALKFLSEGRKDNSCRRKGGNWHYWKIYEAQTLGEVKRSQEETKQAGFHTKENLLLLAEKTEAYLRGEIPNTDWENSPGLEPVWYEWLKELKII